MTDLPHDAPNGLDRSLDEILQKIIGADYMTADEEYKRDYAHMNDLKADQRDRIPEAKAALLQLLATENKKVELAGPQKSYLLGCIDEDLEQYGTSYSQSQLDWIHELRATLKAAQEAGGE